MTPHQITLVRDSFGRVQPIAGAAAAIFYTTLFEADPTLRRLFTGDIAHQGERLMTMIGAAVGMLDRPDALLPVLRQLGARHVAYGVVDAHYATVGSALVATLAQGLGEHFTAPVRDAWIAVYGVISDTMRAGAHEALVAAA